MVAPTLLVVVSEVAGIAALIVVAMVWRRGRGSVAALDVPERIQHTLASAGLPEPLARALSIEGAVFFYALAAWRSKPFVPPGAHAFSYHRRNAYASTLYAVVGVAFVELTAVDLLVRSRHPAAANVLLVVDALAVIWMLGFARSVQLRPLLLTPDSLLVRNGLAASVDLCRIGTAIEFGRVRPPARGTPGYFRASPGQPNALATISTPVTLRRAYGKARLVSQIGLVLDDPKAFESAWRSSSLSPPSRPTETEAIVE